MLPSCTGGERWKATQRNATQSQSSPIPQRSTGRQVPLPSLPTPLLASGLLIHATMQPRKPKRALGSISYLAFPYFALEGPPGSSIHHSIPHGVNQQSGYLARFPFLQRRPRRSFICLRNLQLDNRRRNQPSRDLPHYDGSWDRRLGEPVAISPGPGIP